MALLPHNLGNFSYKNMGISLCKPIFRIKRVYLEKTLTNGKKRWIHWVIIVWTLINFIEIILVTKIIKWVIPQYYHRWETQNGNIFIAFLGRLATNCFLFYKKIQKSKNRKLEMRVNYRSKFGYLTNNGDKTKSKSKSKSEK